MHEDHVCILATDLEHAAGPDHVGEAGGPGGQHHAHQHQRLEEGELRQGRLEAGGGASVEAAAHLDHVHAVVLQQRGVAGQAGQHTQHQEHREGGQAAAQRPAGDVLSGGHQVPGP